MYTIDKLIKYPYFEKLFVTNSLSDILDPLTGLVQRKHIIGFAQSLIEDNVPFTFGMMDLDNFKFVNDTYGHSAGDGVLKAVAHGLIDCLGDFGVAGRYGGDEYLFVNTRDLEYDDKKHFFEGVYTKDRVLRRNVELPNCKPFVTATIGCATFPDNASDYESLFSMIDKTLYRGKSKGRNCYIIYVEEKHRTMEIQTLSGHGLYTTLHNINEQFELSGELHEKLKLAFKTLRDELRISDLFFVDEHRVLRSVKDPAFEEKVPDIDNLMSVDLYSSNSLEYMRLVAPKLHEAYRLKEIETTMIVKVNVRSRVFGFLVFAEPHSLRIWQEEESAILFFLSRLVAAHIDSTGEKL